MDAERPRKGKLEAVLVLSDVHRPYHDKRAWQLMLKAAKALQPKHIWLLGDFVDFYSVSAHSKDPQRIRQFPHELADATCGLDELDSLGATNKIYVEGNHEDRLRRYLQDKAPELYGVVAVNQLLGLGERGWHFVPYKSDTKCGKIHVTHDVGVAGRYAAFNALDTYQHSVLTGHTHRLQYLVEGNAVGEFKLSASFGWLGDVEQVDYMHKVKARKNWALGFGIAYLSPSTGFVYVTPVPIIHYTCVVNGTLFTA